jgi:hypothetical protein
MENQMYDLEQHLLRSMAFSHATFGPGTRTEGVIDHIKKEIVEVENSNGDASEWIDLVILSLDGLTRELKYGREDGRIQLNDDVAKWASSILRNKQAKNELRVWPDWRKVDPDKAIEHDRTGETQ